MNELDLAYLAGFFDGEGSIGILRRKKKKSVNWAYYAVVAVGQKDGGIMDTLKENFGGCVHKLKRDESYTWSCSDKTALEFIKTLLPYLKYKKPQAETVVELYQSVERKKFNMISKEEIQRRQKLFEKIREQKKQFYAPQYAGSTTKRKDPKGM